MLNQLLRVLLLVGIGGLTGCSSVNVHRELEADPRILVRKWVLPTASTANYEGSNRGFELSNPVIYDNTVIFGNRSVGLVALYPKLQLNRWVLPIPKGVVSPLLVEGGSVYFGGGDGFLYAVSVETGRVQWRYDLHNPVISRPTLAQGRLFVTTSDDTVFAFDAGTGKWLWHYRRRSSGQASITGASAPLVEGGEVIVGLSDGFLVSLGVPDGSLKWERKLSLASKFTDVDAAPAYESAGGGTLYVPSYDGALYALKRRGGETIWRFDAGGAKSVTVEGDRLYFPSSDGTLYALQKSNAKMLWRFELDKGVPTQIVVTDRYVIAGSSYQYLYVLDKQTGQGLYRFNVGFDSGFYGTPAYDPIKHRLYVLSAGGNLYAFGVRQPSSRPRPHAPTDPYLWPDLKYGASAESEMARPPRVGHIQPGHHPFAMWD